MIGIKCGGDLEQVADELAAMDEIDYVVITSGSFDLLVEVVCEDDSHLLEILSRVRGVPRVTSTETFVYLKLRKQAYGWGTDDHAKRPVSQPGRRPHGGPDPSASPASRTAPSAPAG